MKKLKESDLHILFNHVFKYRHPNKPLKDPQNTGNLIPKPDPET